MPRGYRQSRRDANHAEIVHYARSIGFSVLEVHAVAGALDLVVGWGNKVDLRVEVKDGTKPPSARRLTPAEQRTMDEWKGRRPIVWESTADAYLTREVLMRELME